MLTFEEARARLLSSVTPLSSERVPTVASLGRVLAEPVLAVRDVPSVDYSAMDGYAVATSDLVGDPPYLVPVSGESRTGRTAPPLVPGSVCRIFTGGELPAGSDAVVMQEATDREGPLLRIRDRVDPRAFVRFRGADLVSGQIALAKGTRMSPYAVALAATVEAPYVTVTRRPVVAILTTGDELRALGEAPRAASVVDAVGPALCAFVTQLGGSPRVLATASDDLEITEKALREAFAHADVVLTVGGVSVGDHDVVKTALLRTGATLDFWRVAIKPGKPLAVGARAQVPFLGLPGNPTSALLTFTLFGAPLLRALAGDLQTVPKLLPARLARDLTRSPGRKEFVRATLSGDGVLTADPLPNQASGAATSMAWADALIVIPEDVTSLAAGDAVQVLRLADV